VRDENFDFVKIRKPLVPIAICRFDMDTDKKDINTKMIWDSRLHQKTKKEKILKDIESILDSVL